jgi:hypothetical protein
LMNLRGGQRITMRGIQRDLAARQGRLGEQSPHGRHLTTLGAAQRLLRYEVPTLMSAGSEHLFAGRPT